MSGETMTETELPVFPERHRQYLTEEWLHRLGIPSALLAHPETYLRTRTTGMLHAPGSNGLTGCLRPAATAERVELDWVTNSQNHPLCTRCPWPRLPPAITQGRGLANAVIRGAMWVAAGSARVETATREQWMVWRTEDSVFGGPTEDQILRADEVVSDLITAVVAAREVNKHVAGTVLARLADRFAGQDLGPVLDGFVVPLAEAMFHMEQSNDPRAANLIGAKDGRADSRALAAAAVTVWKSKGPGHRAVVVAGGTVGPTVARVVGRLETVRETYDELKRLIEGGGREHVVSLSRLAQLGPPLVLGGHFDSPQHWADAEWDGRLTELAHAWVTLLDKCRREAIECRETAGEATVLVMRGWYDGRPNIQGPDGIQTVLDVAPKVVTEAPEEGVRDQHMLVVLPEIAARVLDLCVGATAYRVPIDSLEGVTPYGLSEYIRRTGPWGSTPEGLAEAVPLLTES